MICSQKLQLCQCSGTPRKSRLCLNTWTQHEILAACCSSTCLTAIMDFGEPSDDEAEAGKVRLLLQMRWRQSFVVSFNAAIPLATLEVGAVYITFDRSLSSKNIDLPREQSFVHASLSTTPTPISKSTRSQDHRPTEGAMITPKLSPRPSIHGQGGSLPSTINSVQTSNQTSPRCLLLLIHY